MTFAEDILCGATTTLADAEIVAIVRRVVSSSDALFTYPIEELRLGSVCDLVAGHPDRHASRQAFFYSGSDPWLRWSDTSREIEWPGECAYRGDYPGSPDCIPAGAFGFPDFDRVEGDGNDDGCQIFAGHPGRHYLLLIGSPRGPSWLHPHAASIIVPTPTAEEPDSDEQILALLTSDLGHAEVRLRIAAILWADGQLPRGAALDELAARCRVSRRAAYDALRTPNR
jgi:hypothetical protein